MARKGATAAATAQSSEVSGFAHRAGLTVFSFAAACMTALVLIALESSSLNPLLQTLRTTPGALSGEDIQRNAPLIAAPLVAALLAYLAGMCLIRLIRIQTYRRHLHGYLKQWLRTYAPLSTLGITPATIRSQSAGGPAAHHGIRLADLVHARTPTLLVGERGAGKTAALHELAYGLTRKRALLGLWLGTAPLPVLLTVETLPATGLADDTLGTQIRAALRRFGTRGLAARSHTLLNRGTVAILYDDLDQLPAARRVRVLRQCLQLSARGRPLSVVAACTPDTSDGTTDVYEQLADWQQVRLEPLRDQQVRAALRKSRGSRASRTDIVPELLTPSLRSPGALAALFRLGSATSAPLEQARSLALLFRLYTESSLRTTARSSGASGWSVALVGAIAAGLRLEGQRAIQTAPNGSLGRTLADWLERVDLLALIDAADDESLIIRPEDLEETCQVALRAGVLAQDAGKQTIHFANSMLEAAYAARWLDTADNGLGLLQPELARPEWILPVLFWAGAAEHPGDVAIRLLRLLDTSDGSSAHAGYASQDDYQAAVLALALGAACESLAPVIERESSARDSSAPIFALAEGQLRDLLDRLFRYLDGPDQQDVMRTALARLMTEGGPEALLYLRYLAIHPRIARLVRAQLVIVLGLIGTHEALAVIVSLLDEPDALLHQAVERALGIAGTRALPALHEALSNPSERVRRRATEALAQFGDTAVETAIAGLSGHLPEQRAAAAQTLGALKAVRGEEALAELLARDSAEAVRVAAALALGQIASEQATLALERAADAESAVLVRISVAQALGATRQPQALGTLLKLLADTEPRVRAAAATALGVLGDDRAAAALQEHRDDQDPWTQNAVVLSLRRLGS